MTIAVPKSAPRMAAVSRDLLYGGELTPAAHDGRTGVRVAVRLPSYRGLPLSCIVDLTVTVGDVTVGADDLVLILDGNAHRISELRPRRDLVWFVLDVAELFVPLPAALPPGAHEVTATMQLLTPFATVGRSVHQHSSTKTLPLADAAADSGE